MKKHLLTKMLLVAAMLGLGTNVWAGDKTVLKCSFDDASSPALTAGNRVSFDYTRTSVITGSKFLNAWNSTNGDPGSFTLSLGSTDLSGETWTLEFEWAACGGCNSKADHTTLKAGSTTLFDISGNSNWNTTVTLSYGASGTATLPVPGCDKGKRFTANVGDQYNTTTYWHHFVITGSTAEGVKLTVTNSDSGTKVVDGVTLSETNVNPTSIILEPCCGGAIGMDELHLYYFVAGEVIQTPTASYTNVNGAYRTVTASCDTDGATLYYSTDQENWTAGSAYTTNVSETVYFKAVKSESESEVLAFPITAGDITLNSPVISRSGNTVTITSDQSNILLTPSATIYYTYGDGDPVAYSSAITVAADATITAYVTATGYTNSDNATRAVAVFPTNVAKVINAPANTSYASGDLSGEDVVGTNATYQAIILDGEQWGGENNIYVQTTNFKIRNNGTWYIDDHLANVWVLVKNLKAGDIIVANTDYQASELTNATYTEKYSEGTNYTYTVTADGDVELAFKKINGGTMHYFYGLYVWRTNNVTATIGTTGYTSFASSYPLNISGMTTTSEGTIEAYYVEESGVKNSYISFTASPDNVAAGTGLILKGDAGATVTIPVATSGTDLSATNKLVGCPTATTITSGTANYENIYVLGASKAEFQNIKNWIDTNSSLEIPAGKAYLDATGVSTAPTLTFNFGGESTGISEMRNAQSTMFNEVYNLNGQRVAQPTKGLYITNGRKVVLK